jgi:hypothetical protein
MTLEPMRLHNGVVNHIVLCPECGRKYDDRFVHDADACALTKQLKKSFEKRAIIPARQVVNFAVEVHDVEAEIQKTHEERLFNHRLAYIHWLLDHKYKYNEAIWGTPGVGKSNCAILTALHIQQNFDPSKQILYNITDYVRCAHKLEEGSRQCFVMDEGAIDMSNKRSITLFQQLFTMLSVTDRFKQPILLWCLPNIQLLSLDQKRLLMGVLWLYDLNRGKGEYSRRQEARNGDVYLQPYPGRMTPMVPLQDYGMQNRGVPTPPVHNFDFKPIPEDSAIWKNYMMLKKRKQDVLEQNILDKIENVEELSTGAIRGSMYAETVSNPVRDAVMQLAEGGEKTAK